MVGERLKLVWSGRDVSVKMALHPGGCQLRGSFGHPPITVVRQREKYWAEADFLEFFECSSEYAHPVCGDWKSTAQEALDELEVRLKQIEGWVESVRASGRRA